MFDRYRRTVEEAQDLNIIPVMNLFMVLIPFLLLGAAFYQIGVIPTSLPSHDPQESDVPKTPKTVLANLVVAPDEMRLTFDSVSLDPEELDALGATFPKKGGKYDAPGLAATLSAVKDQYPKSNTLTVIPHEKLVYQELVNILDATRERKTGRLDAKGEPEFEELFPVTIFSKLVRETPPAAVEAAPAEEAPEEPVAEGADEEAEP